MYERAYNDADGAAADDDVCYILYMYNKYICTMY